MRVRFPLVTPVGVFLLLISLKSIASETSFGSEPERGRENMCFLGEESRTKSAENRGFSESEASECSL